MAADNRPLGNTLAEAAVACAASPAASHITHDAAGAPLKNARGGCVLGIDPDTNGAFAVMRWGQDATGPVKGLGASDPAKDTCSHSEPGLDIYITDTPTMEACLRVSRLVPAHYSLIARELPGDAQKRRESEETQQARAIRACR